MSGYQEKGLFIMHLYFKYQSPNTFGSKDIVQVKVFVTLGQRSRSQGKKFWYRMKGLFMRYLYMKYQNPIPNGSKGIAQVKVFFKTRTKYIAQVIVFQN
jgi:hypothetical protein